MCILYEFERPLISWFNEVNPNQVQSYVVPIYGTPTVGLPPQCWIQVEKWGGINSFDHILHHILYHLQNICDLYFFLGILGGGGAHSQRPLYGSTPFPPSKFF